jgi:hypothetical protein
MNPEMKCQEVVIGGDLVLKIAIQEFSSGYKVIFVFELATIPVKSEDFWFKK